MIGTQPEDSLAKANELDLLCFAPDTPEHAIAVQLKLAKISAKTFESLKPNKLQEIPKVHRQASLLVELGFWKVYSCVVVLIDSRCTPTDQEMHSGLTPDLSASLEASMSTTGLHHAAGFVQINLVQPPLHPPLTTGEISSHVRRVATSQQQSVEVTRWLSTLRDPDAVQLFSRQRGRL